MFDCFATIVQCIGRWQDGTAGLRATAACHVESVGVWERDRQTEEVDMLGFEDPSIAAVYILCILSTLLCVVYGALNWNKGDDTVSDDDKKWVEEEDKLEQEL
jgi:hypothetical protein